MKLNFNLLFIFVFIISTSCAFGFVKSNHGLDGYEYQKIDAVKNARLHSNMGNIYFDEKNYVSALKEYEIAYNLASHTTAGSTYLYNIARCFMKIKNYALAQNALLGAIERDCLNMTYYKSLVECFIAQNTQEKELEKYLKDDSNPYNKIIAGLIYLNTNRKSIAKSIFDDFVNDNPDMIITQDIKAILKTL